MKISMSWAPVGDKNSFHSILVVPNLIIQIENGERDNITIAFDPIPFISSLDFP